MSADVMRLIDARDGRVLRSTPNPAEARCAFCGRVKSQCGVLIAGKAPGAAICDRCVRLGAGLLKAEDSKDEG